MWRTRVDGVDGFNFTVMDERPPRTGRWTARRAADGLQGTDVQLQVNCRWTTTGLESGLQMDCRPSRSIDDRQVKHRRIEKKCWKTRVLTATLSARHVVGTSRAPGDFRGEAYHHGSAVNSRAPTEGATRFEETLGMAPAWTS